MRPATRASRKDMSLSCCTFASFGSSTLEGARATRTDVRGAKDRAHSAFTEQLPDAIAFPNDLARRKQRRDRSHRGPPYSCGGISRISRGGR